MKSKKIKRVDLVNNLCDEVGIKIRRESDIKSGYLRKHEVIFILAFVRGKKAADND